MKGYSLTAGTPEMFFKKFPGQKDLLQWWNVQLLAKLFTVQVGKLHHITQMPTTFSVCRL